MGQVQDRKGRESYCSRQASANNRGIIAADLSLMCEWSNNDKNYVVNELLRFAVSENTEFQAYKQSRPSSRWNQKWSQPFIRQRRELYR
jgi:hypothetical protein